MPLADETMRHELELYAFWYNRHRPHQALDGRTPSEVLLCGVGTSRPNHSKVSDSRRPRVSHLAGRAHLPIVELQRAA